MTDSEKQLSSNKFRRRRKFLNSEFSYPEMTPLQLMTAKQKVLFPAPGWTMLRQFTCKQLFRKGNVAQVTHEEICFVNDAGNVQYLSSSSRRDPHIQSLASRDAGQTSSLKKCLKWWLTFGRLLLLVASAFMVYKFLGSDSNVCHLTLRTNVLEKVLKYKLYGQEVSSKEIMTQLMLFSFSEGPRVKAMVFYGDTGVGKSYVASLLGKYFTWPKNVQYLISSLNGHSISLVDEVVSNLSLCGDNLVIFDELPVGQEGTSVLYLDKLSAASKSSGFRIIVILIFNLQQSYNKPSESRLKIDNTFKHRADLILFQPLEEQHIIMCIKEASLQQGILISEEDIDSLLSILVPLHSGCKSVANKVGLVGAQRAQKIF